MKWVADRHVREAFTVSKPRPIRPGLGRRSSTRKSQLLRQLNERDRQPLGRMPRPTAADGLQALCYIAVHSPNSQDLLFTITPAGRRAALATLDTGT
jgi:hypothetical protein